MRGVAISRSSSGMRSPAMIACRMLGKLATLCKTLSQRGVGQSSDSEQPKKSCSRSAKLGSHQFFGAFVAVAKTKHTRSLAPYRATEEAYSRSSVQLRKLPASASAPYRATKEVSPLAPTCSCLLNSTSPRPVKHPAFLAFETTSSVQLHRSISGEDELKSRLSGILARFIRRFLISGGPMQQNFQ